LSGEADPHRGRTRSLADLVAGLSMAGLLLPEAVAYAGIASMPPVAGLIALAAGLAGYAIVGRSRFAIVSSTSSSAAVVAAVTSTVAGGDAAARAAVAAGLVLLTGGAFALAAAARLGSVSSFISKPVLRGFTFGLAMAIVLKQLLAVLGPHSQAHSAVGVVADLATQFRHWNLAGLATGAGALLLLRLLARMRRVPAAMVVVALGIAAGETFGLHDRGVALVGRIDLTSVTPALPDLDRGQWLRLGELALALLLLLFAESYGAIRSAALRHGDPVQPNRDLAALGVSNLVSGLFQGMPVGAGYSATTANEAAGATGRLAGLWALATVVVVVAALLPWIERTPEPVLAAVVIHALAPSLSLDAFRPYFRWRRDRVVVVAAALAVVLLGVLDGLLLGIAVSLAMTLRDLSSPRVSELGRLGDGHDFLSVEAHPEARAVDGLLILRPEAPLFFANAEAVFVELRRRVRERSPRALVLSLEETPDLDGSAIESLAEFAQELSRRGVRLVLARVKEPVLAVLSLAAGSALDDAAFEAGSVDDAVRGLVPNAGPASA
jgi:SulP family sulfate permease